MEHKKIKIVAIDDNPDNLISLKALIKESFPDALTLTATNGAKGIELAFTEDPDVILLDIVMPGMDGFEVCKFFKSDKILREIPVVFITAIKGDRESRIRALEVGAEAFLAKPIDELELFVQINAMLKIKNANIEKIKKKEQLLELVDEQTLELKNAHKATISLLENLKKEIEQRKIIEQELRESEENLKRGEQVAKFGYWKLNIETKIVYLSHGAQNIYGIDKNNITLDELKNFRLPEYAEKLDEVINRAFQENIPYDIEFKIKRQSDGKIIDIQSKSEFSPESRNIFGVLKDITERKQAEEKILQFSKAIDQSASTVVITDTKGNIQYVNPKFTETTGYSFEEVKGQNPRILKSGHTEADEYNQLYGNITNGKAWYGEFHNRRKDGTLYWEHASISPIINEQGEITHFLAVKEDITEHKIAEQALIDSNQFTKQIIQSAHEGVIVYDLNMKYVLWNPYMENITGIPASEVLGKKPLEVFPFLKDAGVINTIEKALLGEIVLGINFPFTIPGSGKSGWAIDTTAPLYSATGSIIGAIAVVSDITERKLAEQYLILAKERIEESDRLNKTLLKTIPFGMHIVDESGTILFGSGILKKQFTNDIVGKKCWEVYRDDHTQCLDCTLHSGIKIGETKIHEVKNVLGGKTFEITHTGMIFNGQKAMLEIFIDITERKQAEKEIVEKNKELENFISITSHDLRSPLINIQGFSKRFQEQTNALKIILEEYNYKEETKTAIDKIINGEIPKTLNFVLSNVTKMDILLKALSQISITGQQFMTIKNIDMNQLFETVIASYNFQITELSAKISVEEISDCYGDENQLNQLFSNIIGNAIKYRDKNRQLIIIITSKVLYDKVIFRISDSGIGIAPRHLEKIWNVFFRVDSASAESGEGIGLSLAKKITDKHKGKIWAESIEGKGSTFYVELQKNEFSE